MLNLNDLFFFARSVDHGSFAAAGRALNIPNSTLSKRVAELEGQLGIRLIERSSRTFVLTDIGREFYRHAAASLIEAEAAADLIKGRLAEPRGPVRITASVPRAQSALARILPELAMAYPKIAIVLHVTDRSVDIIQDGFDIAIVGTKDNHHCRIAKKIAEEQSLRERQRGEPRAGREYRRACGAASRF